MSKPVAYAAVAADGSESSAVYLLKEQAEAAAREWGWFVVPLYALPSRRAEDEIAIEAAWERTGLNPTWPADEAGCGVKYANAMAQEIERLRQFDRLQPIEPADATPATQATPGDGSVHGGSSTPKSYETSDEKRVVCDMKQEPVAWARFFQNGGPQSVYLDRPPADAVPLYRSPTLNDEERWKIAVAATLLDIYGQHEDAATLRSLLERTK